MHDSRTIVNLIAAVGNQGQLGLNGILPWHCRDDLQWFKRMTMGGIVVVGWNTAQKLPNLPGRDVLVFDRNASFDGVIKYAEQQGKDLWIAGGAKTYLAWLDKVDRCYISRIDYSGEADVYMPPLWVGRQ